MLRSILRYLKGWLLIQIVGYSPERFLNLCSHHHIYIWNLNPTKNAYEMCITIDGFKKLKPIIRKTNTRVVILKRYGFPFFLHKYRKRKIFFAGAFLSVCLVYVMSLFIWNIHIEGNLSRSDETLLSYLEEQQVLHGMKKKDVNCSRIVKDIRKAFDDIIWVSASIQGTRLIIQVKENSDTFPIDESMDTTPSDLIANKAGEIVRMITRSGVPQVHIGDTVKEGDLLISGRVEVLNDSKEVIAHQYHPSQADIFAKTTQVYEEQLAVTYQKKNYTKRSKKNIYIKIGKYTITLGSSKHNYKNYEQNTMEKQLKIGEHFYLPISYGRKEIKEYEPENISYSKEQLQEILTERFDAYCEGLTKAGTEIVSHNVKIRIAGKIAIAKGPLTLIEKIGNRTETPIVELPIEENDGKIERDET